MILEGIERGLAEASRFVLVATPESMASSWCRMERSEFGGGAPEPAMHHVHVVMPVWTPLSTAFGQRVVDMTPRAGVPYDETYRQGLEELATALSVTEPLLPEHGAPAPPEREVRADLWRQLVTALAEVVADEDRLAALCLI